MPPFDGRLGVAAGCDKWVALVLRCAADLPESQSFHSFWEERVAPGSSFQRKLEVLFNSEAGYPVLAPLFVFQEPRLPLLLRRSG